MSFLKNIDATWTLFLDRDGVLNIEKDQDYIRNVDEFIFYDDVLSHFPILNKTFGKIIIVTNQRGIGKGLMTHDDLHSIHSFLLTEINKHDGHIHQFYYAPDLENDSIDRKPNIGMGLKAKQEFPEIDFSKSIMVGNNISDMEFGKRLGMKTVYVNTTKPRTELHESIDLLQNSLPDFCKLIQSELNM
jgi:D-glycero-D-manno-heptose 1,7-bisphosphate phosphatase